MQELPLRMNIYKIRSLLEGLLCQMVTDTSQAGRSKNWKRSFFCQNSTAKKSAEQAEQVSELDGKFHKVLYETSNSRILEHVLSDFHKYVRWQG